MLWVWVEVVVLGGVLRVLFLFCGLDGVFAFVVCFSVWVSLVVCWFWLWFDSLAG